MNEATEQRRRILRASAVAALTPWAAVRAAEPQTAAPAAPGAAAAAAAPVEWPPVRLLDGTLWTPESWRGQAGVLVIWASWCPFCHRHNPGVEALHRAVAGRPLRVLGASLDRDPELVRRYVAERGYTFPMTMAGEALRTHFGLRRVTPTTVTFDRSGRLLQRIPGEMFAEDVLELARLAGTPA
jgi:thiol-disulfide isomerase/thioredoxin